MCGEESLFLHFIDLFGAVIYDKIAALKFSPCIAQYLKLDIQNCFFGMPVKCIILRGVFGL